MRVGAPRPLVRVGGRTGKSDARLDLRDRHPRRSGGFAGTFIDQVLNGASPADVPVEQATRFDLVLNLQTARSQGLAFPPAVLLRADRIIDCSERERAAAEL
jgi:hypothetical protein